MKPHLLLLAFFILPGQLVFAQNVSTYDGIMRKAKELRTAGQYIKALQKYNTVQTFYHDKATVVQDSIRSMFVEIDNLRKQFKRALDKADSEGKRADQNDAIARLERKYKEEAERKNDTIARLTAEISGLMDKSALDTATRNRVASITREIEKFRTKKKGYPLTEAGLTHYINSSPVDLGQAGKWDSASLFNEIGLARTARLTFGDGYETFIIDTADNHYVTADFVRNQRRKQKHFGQKLRPYTQQAYIWGPETEAPRRLDSSELRIVIINNYTEGPIPDKIYTWANLRYLDLSNDSLAVLPETLKNLVNLKALNLSGNYFSPDEVMRIQGLLPADCAVIAKRQKIVAGTQ